MNEKINKFPRPDAILRGNDVIDGAGVSIHRLFGSQYSYEMTDPFLLLDFFGSSKEEEYIQGFPWHPHRGIETLTYLIKGKVEHEDSVGNSGVLYPGEIQWMTAGSGIFHQEMPKPYGNNKQMIGFQLWINLPKNKKFSIPTYRHINLSHIKRYDYYKNKIKIISGRFNDENTEPENNFSIDYFEIESQGDTLKFSKGNNTTSLIVPIEGELEANGVEIKNMEVGVFNSESGNIEITGKNHFKYIYLNGNRINENIAWYGPIVMNEWNEIEESFKDLQNNKFIRDQNPEFIDI